MHDLSNGYEDVAREFMAVRNPRIGVATVRSWADTLPPNTPILELGCGHGVPISQALIEAGFLIYGVEASETMATAFRERFPQAHIATEGVEGSDFFGRKFDAVLAWGLLFLLSEDVQKALIRKVASALNPGGRFLFTAPVQTCTWTDNLTKRHSVSLGANAYKGLLRAEGLNVVDEYWDEGENHYYDALKGKV